jgi:hypothetical protein
VVDKRRSAATVEQRLVPKIQGLGLLESVKCPTEAVPQDACAVASEQKPFVFETPWLCQVDLDMPGAICFWARVSHTAVLHELSFAKKQTCV